MTGPGRASSRTILATSRIQSVVASEEPPNLRIFIARNQCSRERGEGRGPPQILSAHTDEFLAIPRAVASHMPHSCEQFRDCSAFPTRLAQTIGKYSGACSGRFAPFT